MFRKVNFVIILFFFILKGAFSETSVMHLSMSLKTTTIDAEGKQTVVPAKISYSKNGSFYFEALEPEKETFFYDASGCYYISSDGIKTKTDEFFLDLQQTAQDLINYFKNDLGLSESQYKIADNKIQNGYIESVWKFFGEGEYVISRIITQSDSKGRLIKLSMFDGNQNLLAQTHIEKYSTDGKNVFPSKIKTMTYSENEAGDNHLVFTTFLEFSDVDLIKNSIPAYTWQPSMPVYKTDNSSVEKFSGSTSISGILVSGAYKFYKKFITNQDIPGCQFYPTCSHYMADCVKAYGPFGIIKGYDRIKRCNRSEKQRNLYEVREDGRLLDFAK